MSARFLSRPRVLLNLSTCCALALTGCSSPPAVHSVEPESSGAAPLDAQGRFDSVWEYLAEKYDADGDGRVSRAEYGRGEVAFARLDGSADGYIDGSDFELEVDGVGVMMSQLLMGVYLQDDDDPSRLDAEELERAFGAYDEDFNALLTRAEFEALHAQRQPLGRALEGGAALELGAQDAFSVLSAGIDANFDGSIEFEELMAFHGRFLADGELPRIYVGDEPEASPRSVARVGQVAPDFTLEPYQEGDAVTLSQFRGKKPVALVFGSYT